jgi:translation initiation factor 1A
MPNIRGGKGYKKGKSGRVRERPDKKIEVVDVSAGEGFFAKVEKKLGGKPAQIEVTLNNGTKSIAFVRGKMHKKVWINIGMIVLVNKDMEIIKIIRDSDKDVIKATEMLDKVSSNNINYVDIYASSNEDSSDDESDEESDEDDNSDDKASKLKSNSERSLNNEDDNNSNVSDDESVDSLVNPNHNNLVEDEEDDDEEEITQEKYHGKNKYNKNNRKSKLNIDDI